MAWRPDRIDARSKAAARDRFLTFLGETVRCLDANAQWCVGPPRERYVRLLPDDTQVAFLANAPVELGRTWGQPVFLAPTMTFQVVRDDRVSRREFRVSTLGYTHIVAFDRGLTVPLASWHYHPYIGPKVPHLHIGGHFAPELGTTIADLHLPTGRVAFEAIVRFLIEDLEVRPAREDWDHVVEDAERRFNQHKRWS